MTIGASGTYTFPIGGPSHYYNPVQLNIPATPTSNLVLTAKYTDGGALTSSPVLTSTNTIDITNSTPAFGGTSSAAYQYFTNPTNASAISTSESVNPGYSVFETACSHTKWFIVDKFLNGGGYWSLSLGSGSLAASPNNYYTIETFPHGYSEYTGTWPNKGGPNRRTIVNSTAGSPSFTSTPATTNFYTDLTATPKAPTTDILQYSYQGADASGSLPGSFSGSSCSDAIGIPGGRYTSFGHFGVVTSSVISGEALPVDLISLTADPINNTFIMVSWATASEQGNKGFEVQRSTDGINFTTIGWVDGNGTTDVQNNYSYNDNTVEPNVVYYYRLNQVNLNGVGTLTYIVSAEITSGPSITVSEWMPNPTTGAIRLVVNTTEQLPTSVKFYDILGKMVISSENQAAFGTNTFDFDLSSLTDGTYTASIRVGTNTYSKKVVLVK